MSKIRPIAIYLPQFHPIPENDIWWGKGFTEWTNVVDAKPLTKNHYQPHLPADLGFYDLRLNEVFYEQVKLAKDAGIYGFMFYEYWFEGKRLLETPIENYLADTAIDFPYFLCWANENWTKRWDGLENEILLKQSYSEADYAAHFDAVFARHIVCDKYIKVNGKPVIAIYKPHLIPNLSVLINTWRAKAKELNLPGVYLINCEATGKENNPEEIGLDAAYEFQPNWNLVHQYKLQPTFIERVYKKIANKLLNIQQENNFFNYSAYSANNSINKETLYKRFPCIMPSWDNTSRRKNGNAFVFLNADPNNYKIWLQRLVSNYKPYSAEENFIFINAWNEWAEGAHLEPCLKWGRGYLEATKSVLKQHD